MKLNSHRLTNTSVSLEQSLQTLEHVIRERDSIQRQLDQSWKRINTTLKALGRRLDWADQSNFRKQHEKHNALQKKLAAAQFTCTTARDEFSQAREDYEQARASLAGQVHQISRYTNQVYRGQSALGRVFGHVLECLKAKALAKSDGPAFSVREGSYDYIPHDVPAFMTLLVGLDELLADDPDYALSGARYRPVSFVEVGCGPGRNVLIAQQSGLVSFSQVSGFEINPDLVKTGQDIFGLHSELQVGDAMDFDYSVFDVVFSFRPFSDVEMQSALEATIAASMREGAYLLAPLSYDLGKYRELMPVPTAPDIWKKVAAD